MWEITAKWKTALRQEQESPARFPRPIKSISSVLTELEQTSFHQHPRWCCWRHGTHAGGMSWRNSALRLEGHIISNCYLLSSFQRLSQVPIPALSPQLTAILQHFREDQSQMATGPTSWTASVLLHINRACSYLAFSTYTGKLHFISGTKEFSTPVKGIVHLK